MLPVMPWEACLCWSRAGGMGGGGPVARARRLPTEAQRRASGLADEADIHDPRLPGAPSSKLTGSRPIAMLEGRYDPGAGGDMRGPPTQGERGVDRRRETGSARVARMGWRP